MTKAPHSVHPVVQSLGPSPTLAINERSNALQAEGRLVYKLGLGQSPFPVPASVVEALKAHAGEKDYLPVAGLPKLRAAVAEYHRRHDDHPATAADVIIGPGSKELMFILQLVFEGETILPSPRWVSYLPQALITGRKVVNLSTTFDARWRLSAEALDAHCAGETKPRLLFINYPGNPDGLTYHEDELRALAEVARKHGVIVLSDEIYGALHHRGEHLSISRFYPEGTVVSAGLSKWAGAGGWRLGTFVFSPELDWLREAVRVVASETFTSVSAPIQYAAIRAFVEGPDIDDYLTRCRAVLSALSVRIVRGLREAGARVHDAVGAFYLFVDLEPLKGKLAARGIKTSDQLCEQLLADTGVAVLPGTCFGRAPEELSLRLAYVNFQGAEVLEAHRAHRGDNLDALLAAHCPYTLTGVDQLCDWLGA